MKVMVKTDTTVYINGEECKIKKGIQEVDNTIATVLIESGSAEKVDDENKKAK